LILNWPFFAACTSTTTGVGSSIGGGEGISEPKLRLISLEKTMRHFASQLAANDRNGLSSQRSNYGAMTEVRVFYKRQPYLLSN